MSKLDIVKIQSCSLRKLMILMSTLFILVFLISSIALDIDNKYENGYAQRMEVNIKSSMVGSDKLLKNSDLSSLKIYLPTGSFSYMKEQAGSISTKNKRFLIKSVKSGEGLDKFIGIKMARGTFFSDEQYKYGRNVAVISENMAYKLFMAEHVIGNEINISNVKYKIIGVYRDEKSLLSLFTSDGIERVYIPFSSEKSKIVDTLFIKDEKLRQDSFRTINLEKNLKERLKIDTSRYKITDFYNSTVYTTQPLEVFIFIIGILCICILIKHFIKYLSFGFKYLKGGMRDYYFIEILLKWNIRIPLFIIGGALVLGFITVIFWGVEFKGYIPYEFIPTENIFDFSFYAKKITEIICDANSNIGYLPTRLELLSTNNLKIVYMLMSLLIINFILILGEIKLNRLVLQSFAKQTMALCCSLITGLAIAFVLCLVIGIDFVFPIKSAVILVVYFSLRNIDLADWRKILKLQINQEVNLKV